MAKVNRSHKVRRRRIWYKNVGDPIELKKSNTLNVNDLKTKK